MRRCKDRDRRTRTARPSAGYATQTSIRSRNAYTNAIERQYIRAIRPFLLVSNLGCRGVNRRCAACHTQDIACICAQSHREVLVNGRAMKVVNIAVNEDDEENLRVPVKLRALVFERQVLHVIASEAIHSPQRRMDCFVASLRNDEGLASRIPKTKMPGTSPGITSSRCQRRRTTPGSRPSCRARPAPRRGARSARGRASTRRSRARSRGRTRPKRDRRHARRRCRP